VRARWSFALVVLAACGGPDPSGDPDAAPADGAPIDAPHVCHVGANLGDTTVSARQAAGQGLDHTMPITLLLAGDVDTGVSLQLELLKGYGVFLENIVPGTFTLADDELDYTTCGLCVRLFADDGSQEFFVTGGSVDITSIDPNLSGTVTGLTFHEIAPASVACDTAIDSADFDAVVTY
jgi:hypothetical protein